MNSVKSSQVLKESDSTNSNPNEAKSQPASVKELFMKLQDQKSIQDEKDKTQSV